MYEGANFRITNPFKKVAFKLFVIRMLAQRYTPIYFCMSSLD